ncbi:hypothetical protein K7X08_031223 [Anisodus acutangulus]|uniref:Uncharacterized protein n=1 Tax=Anisodus acutangulus TaxID=402998 RepID=A0A9Q1MLA0_9SOLA|nr:hypothetical protein K7X08_031223 [Anisodus acutangulus]
MGMDAEDEIPVSTTEPSTLLGDSLTVVNAIGATNLTPVQPGAPPGVPTVILPPVVPVISPRPAVPTLIPPPLAPLPVRPPVLRPPVAQNGEVRASDSDSDLEEMGSDRGTAGSAQEYEISAESKLAREAGKSLARTSDEEACCCAGSPYK